MAMSNRDDFSQKTKAALASRAGYRCSLPNCRAQTIGPDRTPDGSLSIGVACHIHAASPNGPRYDPGQSPEERASIDNGIWCCATCSRIVDGDESAFTAEELRRVRAEHETWARGTLGKSPDAEKLTEVAGEHQASGVGYVVALDIEGPAIIKPGTKSSASGIGNITATRIGRKSDGD